MSSKRDATPGRSPVKKNWRERKASKKKELQDAVERDEKLRQEEKERVRAVEQAEWEKAAVEAGLEQEERKLGQGGISFIFIINIKRCYNLGYIFDDYHSHSPALNVFPWYVCDDHDECLDHLIDGFVGRSGISGKLWKCCIAIEFQF